jgi:hypothetical protein
MCTTVRALVLCPDLAVFSDSPMNLLRGECLLWLVTGAILVLFTSIFTPTPEQAWARATKRDGLVW